MVITVPGTTGTLGSILSDAQKTQIELARKDQVFYDIEILNNHATAVLYLEFGGSAVVASSRPIAATGGVHRYQDVNLENTNLIASASNDEVRVTIKGASVSQ